MAENEIERKDAAPDARKLLNEILINYIKDHSNDDNHNFTSICNEYIKRMQRVENEDLYDKDIYTQISDMFEAEAEVSLDQFVDAKSTLKTEISCLKKYLEDGEVIFNQ